MLIGSAAAAAAAVVDGLGKRGSYKPTAGAMVMVVVAVGGLQRPGRRGKDIKWTATRG